MLLDFLREHRTELIARSRRRVADRPAPRAEPAELEKGIPLFLTQLTEIFRLETKGVYAVPAALAKDSTAHGAELHKQGLTVAQAIHDYGDICHVVTELAAEKEAPITVDEFHIFNRCLDDAMANAVSEYVKRREQAISAEETQRLGSLAHEQRNLLSAAMLAFHALRDGNVGITGSTSRVLGNSLLALRDLTERSLSEVRVDSGLHHSTRIALADLLEEIEAGAMLEARSRGVQLRVVPAIDGAAIDADRQLLASAIGNLLGNALKFTKAGGRVELRAIVVNGQVSIEVEDECGGLATSKAQDLFQPFEQRSSDRSGLGLGLTIARKAVAAGGGKIRVTNLPAKGCIFAIELPQAEAGHRPAIMH